MGKLKDNTITPSFHDILLQKIEEIKYKPELCECKRCGSTHFLVEFDSSNELVKCRNCDLIYGRINHEGGI